jgi:hypothetical protein
MPPGITSAARFRSWSCRVLDLTKLISLVEAPLGAAAVQIGGSHPPTSLR